MSCVGSHILHEQRPCKILSTHTVQVGKHGGTKSILELRDIFTNKKYNTTHLSSENTYC